MPRHFNRVGGAFFCMEESFWSEDEFIEVVIPDVVQEDISEGATDEEVEALFAAMHDDFKYFLAAIWHQLGLPEPTRAQYAIADYLQHGPKRLQIQGFRGVGKSWITGAFALWLLWRNPDLKIIIVSASKGRADNQSIWLQQLIGETPWLRHLRPTRDGARWSRVEFDVACSPDQNPSIKSVGITGQLTGSRGDIIIFDDVEVPGNSATELMREKLLQLCTEAESLLKPLPTSRVIYLGTPQTTFTVYRTLAERGYKPFVWPARYPRKLDQYEDLLAPQLVADLDSGAELWSPTDPARFSEDELLEREMHMGRSNFMLQFMLDTSLSDAEKFPLKFTDLVITSVNPTKGPDAVVWCADPRNAIKDLHCVGLPGDRFYTPMALQGTWEDYTETICSVDPSGRGKDETAAVFMSQRNGFIYVHEVFATKDGYSDNTLTTILRKCKKYGVSSLLIESNFGDGTVAELFKRHMVQMKFGIHIEETRANVRKEDRIIDTLEPVMNQHKLIIDRSVVEWDYNSSKDESPEDRLVYMLFYQMSRMCREKGALKRDDRLDALAQGVKYFTEALSISAYEVVKRRRQEDWQDMVDLWHDEPTAAVDSLVFGMSLEQRRKARGMTTPPNRRPSWATIRP
jgi:hypothetical protein